MAIEFRCNQCGQLLRVPDDSAGKHARCPKCQALMAVPTPDASEAPVAKSEAVGKISENPLGAAAAPLEAPPPEKVAPVPSEPASPFAPAPGLPAEPSAALGGNPFGEVVGENPFSGPAQGDLNPYASPATFASYQPTHDLTGQRIGLPWDTERRTFGCWFRTVRIILGMPNQAFSMMHQHGGLGPPIRYSIYGMGMPAAAAMVLVVPFVLMLLLAQDANDNVLRTIGIGTLAGLGILLGVLLYIAVIATVGNLLLAAIFHLVLMLAGGARQPYETTFRVTAYVYGSLMALTVLPYIGCAAYIWIIVLLIIGLARAHETSTGKAALAVLLPLGICIGGYFVFIFSFLFGPLIFNGVGR